ncbi:MAG: adaptor protein MecA [Clostridia bacterium]|nr:adaptor protein MecA [Clostridia bacterium]
MLEYLKINSSKLKITLTADECDRYGIKERDGEFDSASVREVISDILDEAGVGGSFSRCGEKLLVQLYPLKDGGAELFITRLSGVGEREQKAITKASNINTYSKDVAYFLFDTLDALSNALSLFVKKKKRADVYLAESDKYILSIDEERLGALSDCDIISEFSHRLSPSEAPRPEYDTLLTKGDAIELFSALKA